jgi:amino acid adenylation domain-containing protein
MSKQDNISQRKSLLSPAKQALLAKLTRGEKKTVFNVIPRRPSQDTAILSFAQQRLWFIDQLAAKTPAYNIPIAIRLTGRLDRVALHQSLNQVVERHEVLRTTFAVRDGIPIQAIASSLILALPTVDLREIPMNQREAEVLRLATAASLQPFDLSEGPLLRATLLQLSAEEYVMLLVIHHIISDGWSMGILIRELAMFYKAFSQGQVPLLPKLPIQYADFSVWQRDWLQGDVLQTQIDYWQQQLGGNLPILELPTDYPRLPMQTFAGRKHSFIISRSLTENLIAMSQQEGVTLFMTLLTVFQILLYRYSGQEDICVGSPIANRNRSEIEGLIGFFVNTLVLRTDLGNNPTFRELLQRVRQVTLGAYAHQDLPFEKLVEELQPERSASHTPLFQVMFALQNTPIPSVELPGLTLSTVELNAETAIFDLSLLMQETEQGLMGSLEYNRDLFDAETIARMGEHFQNLLQAIAINPEKRLSDLPLLSAAEQQQLLVDWNNTQVDYPLDRCIHQLIETQVEITPDAVAIVWGNEQLTYRQLNTKANQLAHYLQSLGVGADVLVGICVERSFAMVVGILAILKAGGAYVPLDPAYPPERLAFMVENAQMSVLLTQTNLMSQWTQGIAHVVCVDADSEIVSQQSQENPVSNATIKNLAYVIYTSGSTGQPKGVAIEHHSAVVLLDWARRVYTHDDLAGVLASTSICFDLSVFELFVPLSYGGKVILAENGLALNSLPAVNEITLINTVPSVMAELLRFNHVPSSVRTVNLAGESLPRKLVQQIYQQTTIQRVFNLYGPSEDTTYSTYSLVKPEDRIVTIGRPISNTQVYVLDSHLQPVPVGVPGELYLGGCGLSRGYLHQPELTSQKFIVHSLEYINQSRRLYKTGDLVRYLSDGNLEYLGRLDHQVKIRGFRIELGEIETTITQYPQVREAVVVAQQDGQGEKYLVAYLATNNHESFVINDLRDFLKKRLPEYMIPSKFVLLDALPLTPNGKVDRRALPIPDNIRSQLEKAFLAPRDTLELELTQVWEDILNIRPIGVTDNFFDLGGHSLLTVRLIAQIQKRLGCELPLSALFQNPTIEYLAGILKKQTGSVPKSPLVGIQTAGEKRPFFCVHPAGGNVICYLDLARYLGTERPFYGLQTWETETQQIERMASRYIAEIRTIQPEGPYLLGGWSMGGVVAFEMARQLEQQGQSIELLVLFDSAATATNIVSTTEDNGSLLASFALDIGLVWENRNFAIDEFLQLQLEAQLALIYEQAQQENLILADVTLDDFFHQFAIFQANVRAMQNYLPQTYLGRIVLLQARDHLFTTTEDTTMGWGKLAAGGVEIQAIPGNHYTIVKKPHVEVLAATINVYLNEF